MGAGRGSTPFPTLGTVLPPTSHGYGSAGVGSRGSLRGGGAPRRGAPRTGDPSGGDESGFPRCPSSQPSSKGVPGRGAPCVSSRPRRRPRTERAPRPRPRPFSFVRSLSRAAARSPSRKTPKATSGNRARGVVWGPAADFRRFLPIPGADR